jgi:hypothetical protein
MEKEETSSSLEGGMGRFPEGLLECLGGICYLRWDEGRGSEEDGR